MFENNTDRMFWTIAVLILSATLLMISNKAFPKAQESIMSTISQNIETSNSTSNDLKNTTNEAMYNAEGIIKDPKAQGFEHVEYNTQTKEALLQDYNLSKLPENGHLNILPYIKNPEDGKIYKVTSIGYKTLDETQRQHVKHPFADQHNAYTQQFKRTIKTVTLPTTIKTIGWAAFCANGLEYINIPANVEFIGEWALNNEKFKNDVHVENSTCHIEYNAFSWSYNSKPNLQVYKGNKNVTSELLMYR